MEIREYRGVFIERAGVNGSGIRWVALVGVSSVTNERVRSDTLAGIRELIRETLAAHGLRKAVR